MNKEKYLTHYANISKWQEQDQDNLFAQLDNILPKADALSVSQQNLLNNIKQALQNTKQLLQPLEKYNLIKELGVAGGAIRDLILDKEANDIDIVISFNSMDFSNGLYGKSNGDELAEIKNFHPELRDIIIEKYSHYLIGGKEISTIGIKSDNFENNFQKISMNNFLKVLSDLIKNTDQLFLNEKGKTDNYQSEYICSVIKKNNLCDYPTDLIFINYPVNIFAETFSFDICKGFLVYEDELQKNASNHQWLDNVIINRHMLKDINNKTLTTKLDNLKPEHLEYYLNKHYIKMKEKFPTHQLESRVAGNYGLDMNKIEKMRQRIFEVKTIEQYQMLNEKIPEKNLQNNQRKIKI